MQCKCCYRTGALPCKVRVVGSIPPSGTGSFFLPFFSSFAFLTLTVLSIYTGVYASVGRVLCVYLAGLLTIHFDHTHSSGHILGLW